jgi:glucokinase
LPSRDYAGLEAVVKDYLGQRREKVTLACLGVPGPVLDSRCVTPNIPWVVDARELRRVLGAEVILLNDLEAMGYGLVTLGSDDFATLNEGQPQTGNAALIAPGTGLGEAILFWDGRRHRPSASEGGHASFAPQNELEIALLQHLMKQHEHVSNDRIVSGSGLKRVYDFLKESRQGPEPEWLRLELAAAEDPAAIISRVALEGKAELCVKALDLWVSVFGAEAGNLALKTLAVAGVYLGGGIAPKILPKLKDGTFLAAFRRKGRLSGVVNQMPVRVILNPKTALYGAARFALERAQA